MDELKELVKLLESMPQFVMYILIGYLIYKVVVVGSIYGVIRFGIEKLHSFGTRDKFQMVQVRGILDGMCIKDCVESLVVQLTRLKGISSMNNKHFSTSCIYIHKSDVAWLREAIDEKMQRDSKVDN